ncbi:MAG: fibronectin type III domain-containing protein [Thermoguttaceae bacterium]|nr:fibronectin type III domain-containing protein [Thermoguttaceae bacterium]
MNVKLENLLPETDYEVRVCAYDSEQESPYTYATFSTYGNASFIQRFCEAVAQVVEIITDQPVGVELLANYDASCQNELQITVCPLFNELQRSGRGALKDRVGVCVVFQKRVPYQSLAECQEALDALRACSLNLADCDVFCERKYAVEEINSPTLFDQQQLEESNVFSSVLEVTYTAIATYE